MRVAERWRWTTWEHNIVLRSVGFSRGSSGASYLETAGRNRQCQKNLKYRHATGHAQILI